jgi:hypothetical protein
MRRERRDVVALNRRRRPIVCKLDIDQQMPQPSQIRTNIHSRRRSDKLCSDMPMSSNQRAESYTSASIPSPENR